MRSALLAAPLLAAPLLLAARSRPEPPACGAAALAAAADSWDETSVVTGDLTADGNDDVVFWRREDGAVMLYIAACDGERAVETWRFRVPLTQDCATAASPEIVSPLLDASLVDRVCGSSESDECQHMRQENQRRRALADAGARDLLVGGPGCTGVRFRWSMGQRGFLRIGG